MASIPMKLFLRDVQRPSSPEKYAEWNSKGKYYGYPRCCIAHFCSKEFFNQTENQNQARSLFKGVLFYPCPSCAEKLVRGEVTLEGLLVNRKCRKPIR